MSILGYCFNNKINKIQCLQNKIQRLAVILPSLLEIDNYRKILIIFIQETIHKLTKKFYNSFNLSKETRVNSLLDQMGQENWNEKLSKIY